VTDQRTWTNAAQWFVCLSLAMGFFSAVAIGLGGEPSWSTRVAWGAWDLFVDQVLRSKDFPGHSARRGRCDNGSSPCL
jgi:hypothetical protein